mmetsp:Transcript_5456/g.15594  ORF Transcript_5456/g.15594 Transcript_5456/m.15594 type:complete len:217 (+) Transcript_5456:110-760(+)|eukprot:CAMPEP_0206136638 /NCGR_PEP_ID=MMETSP1473-20131121/1878_1 /ASSEMBLY_ACC=CAM_ASM_001109 /TAXON_ID=1461547 /ORGANISM="Stichococcus sp, Strain RCC1054" /LENGTH=216 /DNA_ID=CAMNT_0053529331 /DNA_START=77 /DNA_END=727 /DNA_ORIENTATION=+
MPESLAVELVLTRLTTSAVPMEIQPAEDQGNAAEPGESHHHTSSSASSGPALDSRQGENQGGNEVGESGSTPPGAPCISAGGSGRAAHEDEQRRLLQQQLRRRRLWQESVVTVDGDRVNPEEARAHCRKMYRAGFALLPLLWAANVWFFWPDFHHGRDPEIARLTRRSAVGFLVITAVFLPWMLTFTIGQQGVFGEKWFKRLDASGIDMAKWGLAF